MKKIKKEIGILFLLFLVSITSCDLSKVLMGILRPEGVPANSGEPTRVPVSVSSLNNWLFSAIRENKLSKVIQLLEKGAEVEAKDVDGNTPLHYSVWYGSTEIVKLLIDKGANIEA